MAWFSYYCPDHGLFKVSLDKRAQTHHCTFSMGCEEIKCKAVIKGGGVQVVERLDNGAMARSVERLANIEEIMNKRADDHSKKVMEQLGEPSEE